MEKDPLRILVVNNTLFENPSYVVRNKTVGEALNKRGHNVFYYCTSFNDINIDDYDFIIFNRFYEGSLKKEIDALRSLGKIIIYETDDNYFAMDSRLPLEKLKKHAIPSANELIYNSDAIIVSTPNLREVISKRTRRPIFTIPNALNFEEYEQRDGGNKQLRIGWQGSDVHIGDLLMIINPLKRLQEKYGFKLILFGISDLSIEDFYKLAKQKNDGRRWSRSFIKLYDVLKDMDYEHYPFTQTYLEFRKKITELNLDIGLCPLEETDFNKAKSCLKYYEYAAIGTVAVASDVTPYHEEMYSKDLVKNNEEDWERKIEELITNQQLRASRVRAQRDWLKGYRNIDDVVKQWEDVFYLILNSIKKDESNNPKKKSR